MRRVQNLQGNSIVAGTPEQAVALRKQQEFTTSVNPIIRSGLNYILFMKQTHCDPHQGWGHWQGKADGQEQRAYSSSSK